MRSNSLLSIVDIVNIKLGAARKKDKVAEGHPHIIAIYADEYSNSMDKVTTGFFVSKHPSFIR